MRTTSAPACDQREPFAPGVRTRQRTIFGVREGLDVVNVGRLGAQSKRRETELYREREHQLQGFDGFEGTKRAHRVEERRGRHLQNLIDGGDLRFDEEETVSMMCS